MSDIPQPPKDTRKAFGKEETSPNIVSDIAGQTSNLSRAVKGIEDRLTTMRKKLDVTEQNMLSTDKKIISEAKLMSSEILDMKSEIADLKEKLMLLVKELKLSATKEEVGIVQKYLSYWEPLNFVTRQELDKILSEKKK